MKLTLVSGTENQPTDCVFDSESESFSLENTAAQAFLAGRGLIPPSGEFTLRDYYRAAEVENSTESRDSTTGISGSC